MAKAEDPEDIFLAELGERVRKMRALRGMSRKVLSQASGLSQRYIAQLESGEGNVSIILLRRVSNAMGAKLEDLIPSIGSTPDWPIIRESLRGASKEQIAQIKRILADKRGATWASSSPRVALIGLRGAGKSTLGRIVAERLGWTFVELNRKIEEESGLKIAEILALYGQEGYRRLEQTALRRLTEQSGPMVLATGGGIVSEPLTFDLVLSSFYTIWLKAKPEEHMRRVRAQGDLRPMGDDRSAMRDLRAILISREPLYARAHAVVDTAGINVEAAAKRLTNVIETNVSRARASEKQPSKRDRRETRATGA
jgi:XRE family transcriptional regulator, aerobic/anaerobic benzoate catabolism transcriptional regulator